MALNLLLIKQNHTLSCTVKQLAASVCRISVTPLANRSYFNLGSSSLSSSLGEKTHTHYFKHPIYKNPTLPHHRASSFMFHFVKLLEQVCVKRNQTWFAGRFWAPEPKLSWGCYFFILNKNLIPSQRLALSECPHTHLSNVLKISNNEQ